MFKKELAEKAGERVTRLHVLELVLDRSVLLQLLRGSSSTFFFLFSDFLNQLFHYVWRCCVEKHQTLAMA